MFVIAGTITFAADKTDEAVALVAPLQAASRAEDGCHDYSFAVESPGVFRVFECWEADEDLQAHFKMPHIADFRAKSGAIGITGSELNRYEVSSVAPFGV